MPEIDLDALEALATAAQEESPGPWSYRVPDDADSDDPYDREGYIRGPHTLPIPDTVAYEPATGAYIAAASPDVVLQLIEKARAWQTFGAAFDGALEEILRRREEKMQ